MDTATNLSYMQQRYYDPMLGQFLSNDPIHTDLNTGANFNRRWYANGNPYRFTDPGGRDVNVQLRAFIIGSAPIQGSYAHQYLYLWDIDTGAEVISRAGPDAPYTGGVSAVVLGSPIEHPSGENNI